MYCRIPKWLLANSQLRWRMGWLTRPSGIAYMSFQASRVVDWDIFSLILAS